MEINGRMRKLASGKRGKTKEEGRKGIRESQSGAIRRGIFHRGPELSEEGEKGV